MMMMIYKSDLNLLISMKTTPLELKYKNTKKNIQSTMCPI